MSNNVSLRMGEDKGKHDVTSTNIIFDEKQ
jgi:hypothetical protein